MDIREIEKIIDEAHKKLDVFQSSYNQTLYEILSAFEDVCSLTILGSILNPYALRKIVDYMDALNMSLIWTAQQCDDDKKCINYKISEQRYEKCCKLLIDYAYPYSVICSGYIGYSRKRFDANVDENCVTFDFTKDQNQSVWTDILREKDENVTEGVQFLLNLYKLKQANSELRAQCKVENGVLRYPLTPYPDL